MTKPLLRSWRAHPPSARPRLPWQVWPELGHIGPGIDPIWPRGQIGPASAMDLGSTKVGPTLPKFGPGSTTVGFRTGSARNRPKSARCPAKFGSEPTKSGPSLDRDRPIARPGAWLGIGQLLRVRPNLARIRPTVGPESTNIGLESIRKLRFRRPWKACRMGLVLDRLTLPRRRGSPRRPPDEGFSVGLVSKVPCLEKSSCNALLDGALRRDFATPLRPEPQSSRSLYLGRSGGGAMTRSESGGRSNTEHALGADFCSCVEFGFGVSFDGREAVCPSSARHAHDPRSQLQRRRQPEERSRVQVRCENPPSVAHVCSRAPPCFRLLGALRR